MTVTGERRPARLPGGVRAGARQGTPRILVDGRVMQDRYHGIGRYTFELLSELSRRHVDLTILHSPDRGRLDTGELMARPTVRSVALRSFVRAYSGRSGDRRKVVGDAAERDPLPCGASEQYEPDDDEKGRRGDQVLHATGGARND